MMDSKLLEILVCPRCKSRVKFDDIRSKIICESCKVKYPIKDDIPVMLIDEAEKF